MTASAMTNPTAAPPEPPRPPALDQPRPFFFMKISPPEGAAGRARHWLKSQPATGSAPAIAGTKPTRDKARPALDSPSRRIARSPGPLEIIAAQPTGHVDGLADEIQARNRTRLHGFRIQIAGIDTAPGHLGGAIPLGADGALAGS